MQNQAIAHPDTRPAPSVGQQGEQALPAVYVKEQTSEGLVVQKKQRRFINLAKRRHTRCPESVPLGCIKYAG